MKFTLRDLAFAIAIFGIGLAFYLHVTATRHETDAFRKSVRHEMMSFEFETKYADFLDSFRESAHKCTINNMNYTRSESSGQYKFECVISRRDGELMAGREFRDLLRPISTPGVYRMDAYKHWLVNTDWELESFIDTMERESWDMEFFIEYRFQEYSLDVELNH